MSNIEVKWVTDKVTGEPIFPITHIDAVRDDDGNPLSDYLNNEEVEIGDTAPTGEPKIFVDESEDPSDSDLLDFYTQEEVDNKIATAPEQNTINSTDFVVLKDADNVNRKISKTNIMGVVKDALAELLLNNDLGTNFTNVPALGANAFGSATLGNLASVLSALAPIDRVLRLSPIHYDFTAEQYVKVEPAGTYLLMYADIYYSNKICVRILGPSMDAYLVQNPIGTGASVYYENGIVMHGTNPVCAFRGIAVKII